jgi:hypothetical protein
MTPAKAPPPQRVVLVAAPGPSLARAPSPLQTRRSGDDLYKAPPASAPIPAATFQGRPPPTAVRSASNSNSIVRHTR